MVLTLPIRDVLAATLRAQIVRLDLEGRAFEYAAGQAVLVATHGHDKRRAYSIAASPEDAQRDGCLELLVGLDVPDAVPDAAGAPNAHLTLDAGALVDVEGPLGSFVFPRDPEERRFVFVAGGSGIAPLRAMLRHALAIPRREIGLFYSARTPDEFAYGREFRRLADAGDIELCQTVTRATDADWTGPRGRLTREALETLVHDPATLCFVCGPPALVDEVPKMLAELGIPRERIRIDAWSSEKSEM